MKRIEAILLLVACLLCTLWYAFPQFIYSMYFPYQLARFLFPEVIPDLDPGRFLP